MKQQFKFLLTLAVIFLLGTRASAADIARAEILSSTCFGCHGSNGVSVSDGMPSIAGLDKRYFMRVMRRFQNGERASTIMGRLAKGYERAQLRMMATYYAEQPWVSASADVSPVKVAKGQTLHVMSNRAVIRIKRSQDWLDSGQNISMCSYSTIGTAPRRCPNPPKWNGGSKT